MMAKPSLFVGSSTEGLEFARAVRGLLADAAEVTLWNEGFFTLGATFLENLVTALGRFDFAVLVLTPDDLVSSRSVESLGPRDNLLFELGLFMGRLGRSRTFALMPAGGLKLPTDLAGLVAAKYDWPRGDGSHAAAVGAACDGIRAAIRDLGISDAKAAAAIGHLRSRQDRQEDRLSRQEAEVRALQVAFCGIVTRHEFNHLVGLAADVPFLCYYSDDFMDELRRLRSLGLATNHDGTGINTIRRDYKDKPVQFDLKRFFYITKEGLEYLALRDNLDHGGDSE
jgi:hypothetical protein